MKKTVLVIETEPETQELLKSLLEKAGLEVFITDNAEKGLEFAKTKAPDFVLVNLYLNAPIVDDSGLNLLRQLVAEIDLPVIVMGRVVDLECVRTVMRLGAYDYVPLPPSPETLFPSIKNLLELRGLQEEVERLRKEVDEQYNLNGLIGRSPQMMQIVKLLPQIAQSESNILIVGESGTGKELIARAIHYNSPRRRGPLIALNCGAFPETLVESELFGHERGAFTGAVTTQKGKLEMAYGGTLFLDEIGEMPFSIQAKLLRVLDERRFMRVGGTKQLEMNTRLLAATNRNIEQAVRHGEFREDLFYRLNVIRIQLPPLRERRGDIPLLVDHFLKELTGNKKQLAPGVMEYLMEQPWNGNVRELRNAVERAAVVSTGKQIHLGDILLYTLENAELKANLQEMADSFQQLLQVMIKQRIGGNSRDILEEVEEMVLRTVVAQVKGNKSKAAELLGIDRKKVERRMAKYGIT
jgi:DNA-binding NtrC family response regulator